MSATPRLPEMRDRQCPRCGDTSISAPTGDGNILALCGHVWRDPRLPAAEAVPAGDPDDFGVVAATLLTSLFRGRRAR